MLVFRYVPRMRPLVVVVSGPRQCATVDHGAWFLELPVLPRRFFARPRSHTAEQAGGGARFGPASTDAVF